MAIWFFGRKGVSHLVAVTFEGSGQLRLNGIRVRRGKTKRNAAAHGQTVCWIEFTPDGSRSDQGLGPEAGRLAEGEVERLLRELPQTAECRAVLRDLERGQERSAHSLTWGTSGRGGRGSMEKRGRA